MEGEDDRSVRGEQRVKRRVTQAVRMLGLRLQLHEVHDIDHPDLQLRKLLPENRYGGESLQRRHIPAAGHDHIRRLTLIVAGPRPGADARSTMPGGSVHRQPLRCRVLAGNHDIDILPTPQAMVHHGQQAVGIRWQVDADHAGLLVHDDVKEARVLVRETVVILTPDVRGQEIVQRRDRSAPGQVRRDLQPLGVLIEHGIHDVDECLVAVEESMPTGEQVALEPALTLVLTEHLHHAAAGSEKLVVRHRRGVPLAIGRFEHRLQSIREGFIRAEDPEIPLRHILAFHVAKEAAQHMRVTDAGHPRRGHLHRVAAKIRQPQVAQQEATIGVGVGPHPAVASWCQFRQIR